MITTRACLLVAGVLAAGALVACSTANGSPATPAAQAALHDQLTAVVQAGAVGALAEVTGPSGQVRATAGVADATTGAPVLGDAEFRAGSATKTFTATVLLQLVGEGRLSLDDTVDHWLPGVVAGNGNDGRRITVRELLQHTSGLYDYIRDLPALTSAAGYTADRANTYTPDQLVALAVRHAPNFAPGTGWSYSNTNYVLAGMIIGKVTGHSWELEVDSRIITPLDLRQTFTPGSDTAIPGPHAEGYSNFGSGQRVDVTTFNPSAAYSAGSIISTTDDLTTFYTALIGGKLLRPAQLTAMEQTVPATAFAKVWPGAGDGLGLFRVPLPCGGDYYIHSGDVPGYHTREAITPDTRHIVVVSVTGDVDNAGLLPEQALTKLVDQQLCAKQ